MQTRNTFNRVSEVASYGDSITSNSSYQAGTPSQIIQTLTSYMLWAQAYSGNKFELMSRGTIGASETDFGYSGAKIADLANGATYVGGVQPMAVLLAKSPKVVVELSGTNDVVEYYSSSAASTAAARIANWDYMLAHGVQRIIAIAIPPLDLGSLRTERMTRVDDTNVILQNAASSRNVTWVPYPSVFKSSGFMNTNYYRDGLHLNHLGAQILGQAVCVALLPFVTTSAYVIPEEASARWITGNPYQSGSVSAGGGQVSTGWDSWFGYSGVIPTKVTDSFVWQRLTTSGRTVNSYGATDAGIWRRTAYSANVNSGTLIRAVLRIRTTSSSCFAFAFSAVQFDAQKSGQVGFGAGYTANTNYPLPLNDFDLTFIGPKIPMATTTSTNMWLSVFGNTTFDFATAGVITV